MRNARVINRIKRHVQYTAFQDAANEIDKFFDENIGLKYQAWTVDENKISSLDASLNMKYKMYKEVDKTDTNIMGRLIESIIEDYKAMRRRFRHIALNAPTTKGIIRDTINFEELFKEYNDLVDYHAALKKQRNKEVYGVVYQSN